MRPDYLYITARGVGATLQRRSLQDEIIVYQRPYTMQQHTRETNNDCHSFRGRRATVALLLIYKQYKPTDLHNTRNGWQTHHIRKLSDSNLYYHSPPTNSKIRFFEAFILFHKLIYRRSTLLMGFRTRTTSVNYRLISRNMPGIKFSPHHLFLIFWCPNWSLCFSGILLSEFLNVDRNA